MSVSDLAKSLEVHATDLLSPAGTNATHLARDLRAASAELQRLEKELCHAYRAVRGYYSCTADHQPSQGVRVYHCLTNAAAIRFVDEGSLEGSGYFEGKPVDVLNDVLRSARPAEQR